MSDYEEDRCSDGVTKARFRKRKISSDEDHEEDETVFTCVKMKKQLPIQSEIERAQESLDDDKIGMYYCVYYDNAQYWGKLLKVSLQL